MNAYLRAAERIRDAGLPLGPLGRTVSAWRASSGSIAHADRMCGRIKNSYTVAKFEINLATAPSHQLCRSCTQYVALPEVKDYVEAASALLKIRTELDTLDDAARHGASWDTVAALDTLNIRAREALSDQQDLGPLTPLVAATLDRVRSLAATHTVGADGIAVVLRRCALPALDRQPSPEGLDVRCFGHSSYGLSDQARKLKTAFITAIQSYQPMAAARQAVLDRAVAMGEEPTDFDQLPDRSALNAADFESARSWAAAEWRLVRDETASRLADHWVETLTDAVSGPPEWVVVCFETYDAAKARDTSGWLLSAFGVSELPGRMMALSVMPNMAALCLQRQYCDAKHRLHVIAAPAGVDRDVVATAATLYDTGGGLDTLEEALEAAQLLHTG